MIVNRMKIFVKGLERTKETSLIKNVKKTGRSDYRIDIHINNLKFKNKFISQGIVKRTQWLLSDVIHHQSIIAEIYSELHAFIIIFGISSSKSLQFIEKSYLEIKSNRQNDFIFVIVADISCLPSFYSFDELREAALLNGAIFCEVNLEKGEGINDVFEIIAREYAERNGIVLD